MIYGFDMKLENWVLKTGSSVTPIQYVHFKKRKLQSFLKFVLFTGAPQ